jgi:glycerate-2-kinase
MPNLTQLRLAAREIFDETLKAIDAGAAVRRAVRLTESQLSVSAPFVALCAGTDGIDGNSPAAGAIVDSTTSERAGTIGLDPKTFLDRSDAYSFFVALGDTIATGATGTNVRDIRIMLQDEIVPIVLVILVIISVGR